MKRFDSTIPIKLVVKNGEKLVILKVNIPQNNKPNLEKKEEFTNKEMNKQISLKLNTPIKKNTESPKIQLKLNKNNITFIDSPRSPLVPPSDEINDSDFDEPIQDKNEVKIIHNNQVESRENVEQNAKSDNEIIEKHDESEESDDEIKEFDDEIKEAIDEFKETIDENAKAQPPKRVPKKQPSISSINVPKTPTESKPKTFSRSKPVSHSHSFDSEMNIKTYQKEGLKKNGKFNQNKKKVKNIPRSSRSSHSSSSEPDFKSKFSIELPEITFNSLQVRKYCEQAYSNDDFSALYNLIEIFDAIRRILMKIKKAVPLRDDELDVINNISIIQVSQIEIDECLTFTVINLPVEIFDPEAWLKVYKEMLPEHGTFNTFNLDSFNALHKIFTRIRMTEISLGREKIIEDAIKEFEGERNLINDISNMSPKLRQKKLSEIDSKIYKLQQEDYHNVQEDHVYKIVDMMKEYVKEHPELINNFNDSTIVFIWRAITGDALIYITPLMNQILNNLQIDLRLFSQRAPVIRNNADIVKNKFTQINIEEYPKACRSIRDDFFNKHVNLTREEVTEEIWNEWKEYFILFRSLMLIMSNKSQSQISGGDIAYLDDRLLELFTDLLKIPFHRYDDNACIKYKIETNMFYGKLQLYDSTNILHVFWILNTITKRKSIQEIVLQLKSYPPDVIIGMFIKGIKDQREYQNEFINVFMNLDNHYEILNNHIESLIQNDEGATKFFIALIMNKLVKPHIVDNFIKNFSSYDYETRITFIEAIKYIIKTYPNKVIEIITFIKTILGIFENSLDASESSEYKTIDYAKTLISDIKELINKLQI